MPPPDASTDTPPPPIPDYELLRLIGRGSYGDVWLARSATGLFRAVKIVWRSRFQDIGPYEREFNGLREFARITAGETLQLSLLHVGRNDPAGFFYYVMDLADDVVTGREIDPGCYEPLTFRTYRATNTTPPIKDVIVHAIELARCLAELHSTGHLHRDIKPSNIILVHGRPKLADIGLVTHSSEALTFVGTEGFMPPEGPGTAAADIYSFGKVLYELATGRDRHDFPRLPDDFGQRSDHRELLELNEIILRACAQNPLERYPDVPALLADLQLLEAGRSVRRLRRAEAGLARARKWVAAAAAIAAVAGVGAYFERQRADIETAARRVAEEQLAALTRRSLYESSIVNAQRALAYDDFGAAREALANALPKPGEPDLRGFEWYALERETHGDPAIVLRTEGARVDRIVLSPNHRLVAIDDASTAVEIYDLATTKLVTRIPGIHRLAGFTPDGRRLVGTNPQYELETWSFADGSPDPRPNRPGIHRPIAVDANAPRLLYFQDSLDDAPHRFAIQNLDTGEDEISWDIPRREGELVWDFHKATASADLRHIAFQAAHGSLGAYQFRAYRWDLSQGVPQLVSTDEPSENNELFAFSPDGELWLRSQVNQKLELHVADQPPRILPLILEAGPQITSNISPDNRLFVLGNRRRQVTVAETLTGEVRATLLGHAGEPNAFAWLPDSQHVLVGSRRGDVRLWSTQPDVSSPDVLALPPREGPDDGSYHMLTDRRGPYVFVPGGRSGSIIVDSRDGSFRPNKRNIDFGVLLDNSILWGVTTDRRLCQVPLDQESAITFPAILDPGEKVREANASPDGRLIVVSDFSNQIYLWDRSTERLLGRMTSDYTTIGLAVDDHGHVIFVDFNQRLQKWDCSAGTPQLLLERHHSARPPDIVVSPDNRWLTLVGSIDDTVVVRNADFSRALLIENVAPMVGGFAFHPDGQLLACNGTRTSLRLFRLGSQDRWEEQPSLLLNAANDNANTSGISRLVFSADGNVLFAHCHNGTMRIWRK